MIKKLKNALRNIYGGFTFNLPSTHQAGMQVPKGGSSCANCIFLGKDKVSCTEQNWIAWNGGNNKLPLPADQYCSDFYMPGQEPVKQSKQDVLKKYTR